MYLLRDPVSQLDMTDRPVCCIVSSYVLLPSRLMFIPKLLRQEYKAGSTDSDFGQISRLLLMTGSKYPSSHSGLCLNGLLRRLPLYPSSLVTLYFQTKG
ncbi:Glycerol kinase [Dissostichus eleginoides]|uniref:Glycerol kinase n=1 Tax=Dissostichus eleginoides TaxID=100907 RepID=A0AAD9B4X9_DISEL|nr:Glycerol kinase [Dissostichus eleginoides]